MKKVNYKGNIATQVFYHYIENKENFLKLNSALEQNLDYEKTFYMIMKTKPFPFSLAKIA